MRTRHLKFVFIALALVATGTWMPLPAASAHHSTATGLNGAPWLGHAMIGTSTNHDRRYHVSVVDVGPTQTGDVAEWDYAPNQALRLRLEWWFENGGGPGHNARSAKVYLRDPNGLQIGTDVWDTGALSIPDGCSSCPSTGVIERTIHLDNNPMDGNAGPAASREFERSTSNWSAAPTTAPTATGSRR